MQRFWDKVGVVGPDECWEWLVSLNNKGYGQFGLGDRLQLAHRVAWALTHGPIPEGQCVCHKCDNPSCVNPAHLFLGTQAENIRDAVNKGRHVPPAPPDNRGERHGMAKLNEMKVRVIRRCLGMGFTLREVADLFGVSVSLISMVKTRKRWSHV